MLHLILIFWICPAVIQAELALQFSSDPLKSIINAPNQPYDAIHKLGFTIALELIDTATKKLCVDDTVVVRASCTGLLLEPEVANLVNGVATFDDFKISNCGDTSNPCQLVFEALGGSDCPTTGQEKVSTGPVTVKSQPAFDITLSSLSFLTKGKEESAVVGTAMPVVVVQVIQSCGEEDEANGITVTATSTAPLKGVTAVSSWGKALFDNLVFTGVDPKNGKVKITFTASTVGGSEINGKQVISEYIALTSTVVNNVKIRFSRDSSFVTAEGQGVDFPVGKTVTPPIVIEFVDSTGSLDVSDSVSDCVVAYNSPSTTVMPTIVGATAKFNAGKAAFTSLQFDACLKAVDGVLVFTVKDKEVRTGQVLVRGASATKCAFRNNSKESLFTNSGSRQDVRIANGEVIIPQIVAEVRDACGAADYGVEGYSFTIKLSNVTTDVTLQGTVTQPVSNGQAVFTNLKLVGSSLASLKDPTVWTLLIVPNVPSTGQPLETLNGSLRVIPSSPQTQPPNVTTAPNGTNAPNGNTTAPRTVEPSKTSAPAEEWPQDVGTIMTTCSSRLVLPKLPTTTKRRTTFHALAGTNPPTTAPPGTVPGTIIPTAPPKSNTTNPPANSNTTNSSTTPMNTTMPTNTSTTTSAPSRPPDPPTNVDIVCEFPNATGTTDVGNRVIQIIANVTKIDPKTLILGNVVEVNKTNGTYIVTVTMPSRTFAAAFTQNVTDDKLKEYMNFTVSALPPLPSPSNSFPPDSIAPTKPPTPEPPQTPVPPTPVPPTPAPPTPPPTPAIVCVPYTVVTIGMKALELTQTEQDDTDALQQKYESYLDSQVAIFIKTLNNYFLPRRIELYNLSAEDQMTYRYSINEDNATFLTYFLFHKNEIQRAKMFYQLTASKYLRPKEFPDILASTINGNLNITVLTPRETREHGLYMYWFGIGACAAMLLGIAIGYPIGDRVCLPKGRSWQDLRALKEKKFDPKEDPYYKAIQMHSLNEPLFAGEM